MQNLPLEGFLSLTQTSSCPKSPGWGMGVGGGAPDLMCVAIPDPTDHTVPSSSDEHPIISCPSVICGILRPGRLPQTPPFTPELAQSLQWLPTSQRNKSKSLTWYARSFTICSFPAFGFESLFLQLTPLLSAFFEPNDFSHCS